MSTQDGRDQKVVFLLLEIIVLLEPRPDDTFLKARYNHASVATIPGISIARTI